MSNDTTHEPPRFKHDCDACKYLGRYDVEWSGVKFDLYYCDHDHDGHHIARFGDEGAYYLTEAQNDDHHAVEEATRRAIAAGLLPAEPSFTEGVGVCPDVTLFRPALSEQLKQEQRDTITEKREALARGCKARDEQSLLLLVDLLECGGNIAELATVARDTIAIEARQREYSKAQGDVKDLLFAILRDVRPCLVNEATLDVQSLERVDAFLARYAAAKEAR